MDYADEPYRRMYSRRTVTNKRLGWEGRAVMHEMGIYELDRAGVFEFPQDEDPVESVAVATDLPAKVVRVGLERLFKTKTWLLQPGAIVWPNYVHAQNCARSDRLRQQESRERRRDEAMSPPSRIVTNGHDVSREVTAEAIGHPQLSSAQHSPTQLSSAQLSPERVTGPRVQDGGGTQPATWTNFPDGWRWSAETEAAAVIEGVSPDDLQEHVKYWTTHVWGRPVRDLDGELRRSIGDIRKRAETLRAKAATSAQAAPRSGFRSTAPRWEPSGKHAAFAADKALPMLTVVDTYRREMQPDELSLKDADTDFMRRLVCWHVTGAFIAKGPLPKAPPRKTHPLPANESEKVSVAS
jgi:hypothetical protein